MKTTLELPDDLLIKAKAIALKRRTTLRAVVEHALRREIGETTPDPVLDTFSNPGEQGFPVLKKTGSTAVTPEMIQQILEETES